MSIKDYNKYYDKKTTNSIHAPFFPKNIFAVIAGSTGSGKTNLLMNFLFEDGYLDYGSVYFYCSTLHQPAYQYAMKRYKEMEDDIDKKFGIKIKIAHFFESNPDEEKTGDKKPMEIIDPKKLDPKLTHIMVFDDVMFEDQTIIRKYFCAGRHNNANSFYLCQSLNKVPKHGIRENANVFILFRQGKKTLKSFYDTHISGDMDFKEFVAFCDRAWNKKHGFVVINIWEESHCGRYISNYEDIYTPNIHKNT